jgi:hypothetical protein
MSTAKFQRFFRISARLDADKNLNRYGEFMSVDFRRSSAN